MGGSDKKGYKNTTRRAARTGNGSDRNVYL